MPSSQEVTETKVAVIIIHPPPFGLHGDLECTRLCGTFGPVMKSVGKKSPSFTAFPLPILSLGDRGSLSRAGDTVIPKPCNEFFVTDT